MSRERPATQATEALIKNHIAISYNRHFRENNTSLQYRRNLRRPEEVVIPHGVSEPAAKP